MLDIELIKNTLAGNSHCFGELYDTYFDKIYRFVFLKTRDSQVAEDITSEVFLSVFKHLSSFRCDAQSNFNAWIYKIAYNKVIDFYKQHKEHESLEEHFEKGICEDIGKHIDDKDTLEAVVKYIKTMKPEHVEILVLRIWEDLSYKEIAEITGKGVDNCKKIVSRMLQDIGQVFLIFLLFILF